MLVFFIVHPCQNFGEKGYVFCCYFILCAVATVWATLVGKVSCILSKLKLAGSASALALASDAKNY